MKSKDIRETFISFFKEKGHAFAPPSPVAPKDDPTLLFINAGMNQFKDVFLGEGNRPYTRAVNSQVCIRVSGKHNDLEDVGKDTTHQTSFEMLGNWSFGDFYKKEAITWAWELFTEVFKIEKSILYATVFETDDESEALWKSETDINPDNILRCGKKDNFWEMGETGPCGPCSELHVDLGPKFCDQPDLDHECAVNGPCNRYVEFWNLVFIQYNRTASGDLENLSATHVDTGAGLERIAAFLQGVHSNYLTDLFTPIIDKIAELSGIPYQDNATGMPHRVMADHIRTLVFGIADNVLPSNEGRGYVLRRLLRRALRYAKKLNFNEPTLYKLVPVIADIMGDYLPQIKDRESFIITLVKAEEEQFLRTLDEGLKRFDNAVEALDSKELPGPDVFQLYDTYGFPVDLTQVLAEEKGLSVDMAGFEKALAEQKERSRQSTKKKQNSAQDVDAIEIDDSKFEGLNLLLSEYKDKARGGEARLIADPTEKIEMARHHTATHLLHEALRETLGDHVQQAGSLVDTNRLRFDYTHFSALNPEMLQDIEAQVNQKINESIPLSIDKMTLEQAKAKGAMALFGEKYNADEVRVVGIGTYSTELCGGTHVGNTQMIESFKIIQETAIAAGTRRIEALAGQELVAKYDLSQKQTVLNAIQQKQDQVSRKPEAKALSGEAPKSGTLSDTLEVLKETLALWTAYAKSVQKAEEKARDQAAAGQAGELEALIENNTLVHCFEGMDLKALHTLSDQIVAKHKSLRFIAGSTLGDKGFFLVKFGADVDLSQHDASQTIKTLTDVAGGGGGGKATKAQAGGANPSLIKQALESV